MVFIINGRKLKSAILLIDSEAIRKHKWCHKYIFSCKL